MRTFEDESILFSFSCFLKHICLQDRTGICPPLSLARTARMHLKHAKERQIHPIQGGTTIEGVRQKIRRIPKTKTTGTAARLYKKTPKHQRPQKLCFDVLSLFFVVEEDPGSTMEYTFRAVTHRPGILIWRIEVIWLQTLTGSAFMLGKKKKMLPKKAKSVVFGWKFNRHRLLCGTENGSGTSAREVVRKLLRGGLLHTSVCTSEKINTGSLWFWGPFFFFSPLGCVFPLLSLAFPPRLRR